MLTVMVSRAVAQDPGIQAAQLATPDGDAGGPTSERSDESGSPAGESDDDTKRSTGGAVPDDLLSLCAVAPKFSVRSGNYSSAVTVRLKDRTRGAVIYYTTDGWTPTTASTPYIGPITIDATTSLQAIAIAPNGGAAESPLPFTR